MENKCVIPSPSSSEARFDSQTGCTAAQPGAVRLLSLAESNRSYEKLRLI
ncbi:MAG: hypothetical protein ACYTEW_26730 [Planctomycetota bacterium]|jgi:hypothetical protein